ncbi:MAG: 7TM-DISM domain-containing protein, partial [Betaproteobacteria bacterium]
MLALLCLLAWLPGVAAGQQHILEKAYWTDTSGSATFEQARAAVYTPYSDVLSKGFSRHVQWVRLRIAPLPAGDGDALVLRLRPVYIDQVTLFDPVLLAQGMAPASVGDRTPWESNQFESLNHNLLIPGQAQERYIWLRLQTASTQMLHAEAMTPREMLREEHTLWLVYSALLALIMSFLLWVLMAWLRDRDPVNGVFVIRQAVLLIYTACFLGYHRILLVDWMSPTAQDTLYNWLVLLTTGLSVAFEYRFVMEYRMSRASRWLLRLLLLWSFLAMALMLGGQTRLSLHVNMVLNGVAAICLLLVSLRLQRPQPTTANSVSYQLPPAVVCGYYAAVLLLLVLNVLPSLGLLSGTLYT